MSNSHLRYRPEVDGLRAIAILSVLFFHARLGFPGGYVGVDIFFVISGYLITTLILRDAEAGRFSIIEFWERRARRIIPALSVMIFVVLVVGCFLLFPPDLKLLGRSAMSQALFIANIFFWKTGGYFDGPADEKPLLHTWSLAVEEQFYLIFPLLLILCFRFPFLRTRRGLIAFFSVIFAMSLAASIFLLPRAATATFFLLPTRAWELLAGSLLAFLPFHWNPKKKVLREACSNLGLLLIFLPVALYSGETPFPGLAAVPPCLGTVLIIWANGTPSAPTHELVPLTSIGRVLASRPFVFIGLISYSLYLWHWPLLAFAKDWTMQHPPLSLRLAIIFASVVLGILSWRYVETPFRKGWICPAKWQIFTFSAACLGLSFLIGGIYKSTNGLDRNPVATLIEKEDRNTGQKIEDIQTGRVVLLGTKDKDAPIDFVIWGDSHASRAMPAFEQFAKKRGLNGRMISQAGTNPIFGLWSSNLGTKENSQDWMNASFDYIRKTGTKTVVLVSRWEKAIRLLSPEELKKSLLATIERFNAEGITVYICLQIPAHKVFIPKIVYRSQGDASRYADRLRTPAEHSAIHSVFLDLARENTNPMAIYLDPAAYFLNTEGSAFVVVDGKTPIYSDDHHITADGARRFIGRMLEERFIPAIAKPKASQPHADHHGLRQPD